MLKTSTPAERYLLADGQKVKDAELGEELEYDSADSSESEDSTGSSWLSHLKSRVQKMRTTTTEHLKDNSTR